MSSPTIVSPIDLATIPVPVFVAFSALVAFLVYRFFFHDPRRSHLPPGPKGWPILGNTFDVNMGLFPQTQLMDWSKTYGEIFYLKIASSDFIFLNSPRVVKELVDRRGNIYSDRPHMPMAGEAYSRGLNLSLMPYNDRWKTHRKLLQGMLTQKQAESFRPIQQYESKQMAVDWLDSPQDYYQHTRRYAFSLIMQVVYGRRFPKWGSQESDDIFGVNANLSYALTPGKFIVDTFPSLENIPGFGTIVGNWKKTGDKLFQQDAKVLVGYYRTMKEQLAHDNGYPCFARDLEENEPASHGMDEVEAAYLAGGLVMPGSESTSALLNWLVRALATWPEIQTDAREELDRVVRSDRTPTWDDEAKLPYIRAMVKELLRWCLGSKFGLIRSTSQDDWSARRNECADVRFEGAFIPKGSKVVINQWSLHFDDGRWPEPLRYNPRRYLGSVALTKSAFENLNTSNPEERDHWGYGAGRRWCPGLHVGEKSLFINIARIVWGFDIQKPAGVDWEILDPEEGGFNVPKPANVIIRPRSAKHEAVLRKEWNDAQKEGLHYKPAPRAVFTKAAI